MGRILILQCLLLAAIVSIEGIPVVKDPMLGEYFEGDMRFADGYDIKSGIIGDRYSNDERNIVLGALAEISEKTSICGT
ncbi:hypothetical protein Ocin01_20106 [Orchesella cincta]|uniref:Uncharacterized protein n=1 Tax=Orchesella cincta TaxID=48709 RepID=A0A1D2M0T5_ORCCI|nr:hypothetical protein Ocin01_20106 [Orchesella cincta]